ncbi:MAG: hypothetical protein IBX72_01105 [Nitrospirae bacterium]|nr:hypothetical protein [Nitrospirota bacterium]
MKELSNEQIEKILDLLKKGSPFPEDYRLSLIKYLEQIKNFILLIPKKNTRLFVLIKSVRRTSLPKQWLYLFRR